MPLRFEILRKSWALVSLLSGGTPGYRPERETLRWIVFDKKIRNSCMQLLSHNEFAEAAQSHYIFSLGIMMVRIMQPASSNQEAKFYAIGRISLKSQAKAALMDLISQSREKCNDN